MICVVTDRRRLSIDADATDRLVDLVAAAAEADVDLIQIRERDLSARELFALARRCVEAARGTATKIVVNDRVDVAVAAGAHGVHLRGDSLSASAARGIVGRNMLVGCSVHSVTEAETASATGAADYLILGTLFATASKPGEHPVLSLDELAEAASTTKVPVLAIGGITVARAEAVGRAGAAGVAGIGLFIPPDGSVSREHLRTVVGALRSALQIGVRHGAAIP